MKSTPSSFLTDWLTHGYGVIVRDALKEVEASFAVTVTEVFAVTFLGVNVKVADVLPEGTVTVAGTGDAVALELVSETTRPELPAGPLSVTVPVTEPEPPLIDSELSVKLVKRAGVIVNVVFWLPLSVPVTVTIVLVATPNVFRGAEPVV